MADHRWDVCRSETGPIIETEPAGHFGHSGHPIGKLLYKAVIENFPKPLSCPSKVSNPPFTPRQPRNCATARPAGDLAFAAANGVPLDGGHLVRRHFKPILLRAELPEAIRLYDLRHTCASLLLAAGENAKVVSERLGHAGITLTLDTYGHVMPGMQEQATAKIEKLLSL